MGYDAQLRCMAQISHHSKSNPVFHSSNQHHLFSNSWTPAMRRSGTLAPCAIAASAAGHSEGRSSLSIKD